MTCRWINPFAIACVCLSLGGPLGPGPATSAAEKPTPPVPADHAKQMAAGLELFKNGVRDLLSRHCLECHGGDKVRSDLDLATREGLLKGGADGVAVIPGNAAGSRLLKLLRHEQEPHMPNKRPRLSDDAIAQITAWIEAGAPYDRPLVEGATVARDRSLVTEQDKRFWSFQPLKEIPPPAVRDEAWVRTPIDRFILAPLQAKGISPNAPIERRKLIRRVYFDLIGLPPAPEEVEAFVASCDPRAYEKLVDHLLASPHYGERWGRHWLDLARFGESHGYEQDDDRPFAYTYRDFVIRALNDGLPYDRFVRWQIAGDELEPDNPQAWMATGFLAAGTHATQITANQAEKERYDELDDKINTIGTAFLGLTIGCARCHDHKFDPIPAHDYYRLVATFTTTVRSEHDLDLNPAQTRAALDAWEREHRPLVEALRRFEREQLPARRDAWLQTGPELPQPAWLALQAEAGGLRVSGRNAPVTKSTRLDDGSYLVAVTAGAPDTYTFTARTTLTNLRAVRLEALTHKSLPDYGPGWSSTGAFQLNNFTVTAKPLKGDAQPVSVRLVNRRATNGRLAGEPEPAGEATAPRRSPPLWSAGEPDRDRDQALAFEFLEPVGFADGTEMVFTLRFPGGFDRQNLGRFRLSLSTHCDPALEAESFPLRTFVEAQTAAALSPAKRAERHREALTQLYRTIDPEWQRLHQTVQHHARLEPRPAMVKALVCSEGLPAVRLRTQGPDFYDKTYVLRRGDLAQKQEEAIPGFLQVLMRAPDPGHGWRAESPKESRTPMLRTALANWITDVEHGAGNLLARVIVNRLWQHHLGRGIVATPSDFGATGAAPTHPELLDWLAGELIRNGWQLKPLHKLILSSAVYLQDTRTDEARMRVDPENLLWWHRSPRRLEAEIIRDSILAVAGRLDRMMFGPGSLDEEMTRRSIYFTIKRSQLIPMMVQFDWPDSLQGIGRRVNTTVAPQALLLMNNPHVRAAAQDFAARLGPAFAESPAAAVERAYALALGRAPTRAERDDAVSFLRRQAATYDRPDAAAVALADFCQTVLALNEFIYVE